MKRCRTNPGGVERSGVSARDAACDRLKPGMQAGEQAESTGHLEPFLFGPPWARSAPSMVERSPRRALFFPDCRIAPARFRPDVLLSSHPPTHKIPPARLATPAVCPEPQPDLRPPPHPVILAIPRRQVHPQAARALGIYHRRQVHRPLHKPLAALLAPESVEPERCQTVFPHTAHALRAHMPAAAFRTLHESLSGQWILPSGKILSAVYPNPQRPAPCCMADFAQ